MARSTPLSVERIAAALIGTALIGAGVIAVLPISSPAPAPAPAAPPKPELAKPATPPAPADPALYPIRSALTIDHQMKHGEWIWDENAAPVGGPDGNVMLVTVDLKAQMMSVFRGGHEIGVAVIGHGASDKPTPLGVFTVTQKDADHRSSIYNGAPMPYAMRLTADGVFIHGSNVRIEWGTNGCIGVPVEFAKKLFDTMPMGGRVVITNGAVMQVGNSVPVT